MKRDQAETIRASCLSHNLHQMLKRMISGRHATGFNTHLIQVGHPKISINEFHCLNLSHTVIVDLTFSWMTSILLIDGDDTGVGLECAIWDEQGNSDATGRAPFVMGF